MEYKVLIKLYVPEINECYELYVPINKTIGWLAHELTKIVHDLSKVYPIRDNACLLNRRGDIVYDNLKLVRETNIGNSTELVLY